MAHGLPPGYCSSAGHNGGTRSRRDNVLARYEGNRSCKITSMMARQHVIGPVHDSKPAYRYIPVGDGDGVVC